MVVDEYRRSLKMPEAEEILDLVIFRPSAFLLVKLLDRLPVTPNGVTIASLLCGLAAAWNFSTGRAPAILAGAIWYAAANVLDCADGQLARLQGSGTFLGRVIDGVADYVSSIAIFAGIGIGLAAVAESRWLLVAAAGISSAAHAIMFDHYQSEFISAARTGENFVRQEIEQFMREIDVLRMAGRSRIKVFILTLYVRYLRVQERIGRRTLDHPRDMTSYRSAHRASIRTWSFLGPTTNRTALIACALWGHVDYYLLAVVVPGNLWLAVACLAQRRSERNAAEPASALPG